MILEQKKLDRLRLNCARRVQEGYGDIRLTVNTILPLIDDLEEAKRERDAAVEVIERIEFSYKDSLGLVNGGAMPFIQEWRGHVHP